MHKKRSTIMSIQKIWDKKAYSLKTLLTYHWNSQGVHYGVKVGRGTGAIIESHIKQVKQENSSSSKKRTLPN